MSPIDNSPAFLGPTKREQVMTNKKAEARAKEVRENKAQSEFDAVLHKYMDKANERHSGVEKEFTGLVYVRHDFNDRNMPIHPHVRLWQITLDGQQYLCPSTNGGSKKDATETEYVILPDGTVYAVHCNYLSEKADFSTISEIDKQHERFPLFEGAQKKEEGISLKYKVSQDYGKPIFERSTFTTDGEVTIDDHTISIESINIETQPDTTFNSDSIDRMESVTKTLSSQLGISK